MSINPSDLFDPLTVSWFSRTLGTPTAVQEAAWPAIAEGGHTLVSAPTGTGKTLSAFLVFIDRLKAQARAGLLKQELSLIYVSPLKALAGDIRENLRRPLNGILEEELRAGFLDSGPSDLSVAIRTGDTTQSERRGMIKKPPHILITTPESLYLMLTSKSGQSILHTARYIIIDELHALIDSKRGAHLMLSIARLDKLCKEPLQRIGLSATIEPLSKAAEYLSPEPAAIIAPKMEKEVRLEITSPLAEKKPLMKDPVWQELAGMIYEKCLKARSVIAFVEGRRYAEKLAYYVNLLGGEGFARTHHGSLSKEQRFYVEDSLRNGSLRLLCATSSMELGIDVGDIDQVFQVGCPRSISSTMQRLGRAGHNPDRVSVMQLFPRAAVEGLYCGLTAEVVRQGGVEYSKPPRLCLDILAQHLVSMAAGSSYSLEEVMDILARAYPFAQVTLEDVRNVLCMLSGDYEHERDIPVRPRVLYDRIHDRVEGDAYSRMLAVSAGGTIPDKGLYSVKTDSGVKLGELDEEFIFESRVGDRFLLGTFAWQITDIQKDTVLVSQAPVGGARLPFWKGEIKGRRIQTGIAFGKLFKKLSLAEENGTLKAELLRMGLNEPAADSAAEYLKRQLAATEMLPNEGTILVEHFRDENGLRQMMVHSLFGRPVNEPLAILLREAARTQTGENISYVDDDDGILIFPFGDCELPEGLLYGISPDSAERILSAVLPAEPLFNMTFRYNTGRALMMGVRKSGRQPLWLQRMRSAEMLDALVKYESHPIIRETKRECMEDLWDLEGLKYVLNGIQNGNIRIREMYLETPSPMSLLLRQQTEASMMYDYTPTPSGIIKATEESLKQVQMIAPAAEQLALVSERLKLPEDENQLHSLLMMEGDLIAGELDIPIEWLETLVRREQVLYIEPGLWIAAEHKDKYESALLQENLTARAELVRKVLRYRGEGTAGQIGERYFWSEEEALKVLDLLKEQGIAVKQDEMYYHGELYQRAQRETVKSLRRQIRTLPSERYAALLVNRVQISAPPAEQLERTLKLLAGQSYQTSLWESTLLPYRVRAYRGELLDNLLAQGNFFWQLHTDEGLRFHRYEDINWEADLSGITDTLEGNEKIVYEALLKRGASFIQRLSGLTSGGSPFEALLNLAGKGLVCADSYLPVRWQQDHEKLEKTPARRRVGMRTKAMSAGRWEITHPLNELTTEQQLERVFDRMVILCKETAQGLNWTELLSVLRVWEYTGRVRRGYFIEGLSGIQFIREKDFTGTMAELEQPGDQTVWIPASDPSQPWGKYLAHRKEYSFLNVAGTAAAIKAGLPAAVFERQGKVLRIFDETELAETLKLFILEYNRKRLFPAQSRIVVKQYPKEAEAALTEAGFIREMQDYVLYRK